MLSLRSIIVTIAVADASIVPFTCCIIVDEWVHPPVIIPFLLLGRRGWIDGKKPSTPVKRNPQNIVL